MYLMNGMTREATQGLAGWKAPSVMGGVNNKTKSEGVAPEMRGASRRARTMLNVEEFAEVLENDAFPADERVVGLPSEAYVRIGFRRSCSLAEFSAPSLVLPICANLSGVLRRRARKLALTDA